MEWQRDLKDPTEFIETVKMDLFQDEVFVFTPKGDVKALPKGATPIDFAYAIHSQVGEHCSGAQVNGLIVPLRYKLRNGDTVEILTSANQKPSKDWLKFVITSRAKHQIRHFIRMEQRERSRPDGARSAGARAAQAGPRAGDRRARGAGWTAAAQRLRLGTADDLLVAIGYGKVSPAHAADAVLVDAVGDGQPRRAGPGRDPGRRPPPRPPSGRSAASRSRARRTSWSSSPSAARPVPGDSSSASSAAVTASSSTPASARRRSTSIRCAGSTSAWDDESKTLRPVAVQVTCSDRPGLLAAISKSFTEHGVNISQAKCRTTEDGRAVNTFQVTVGHLDQLKTVLRSLETIQGVVSATAAVIEGPRRWLRTHERPGSAGCASTSNMGKKRKAVESKRSTPVGRCCSPSSARPAKTPGDRARRRLPRRGARAARPDWRGLWPIAISAGFYWKLLCRTKCAVTMVDVARRIGDFPLLVRQVVRPGAG